MIRDFLKIDTFPRTQKTNGQLAEETGFNVTQQKCEVFKKIRGDEVVFWVYVDKKSVTSIENLSRGFRAYFLNRFFVVNGSHFPDYVQKGPAQKIFFTVEILKDHYFLRALYVLPLQP